MEILNLEKKLNINYRTLIETIMSTDFPIVCVIKDRDSRIVEVSRHFYVKHPEFDEVNNPVIGKNDFDLFPNSVEHAKQAFQDEQEVMTTGVPKNIWESEGVDEKGRIRIAQTRKYPVYNDQKEIVGIFVMTEDLTNDIALLKEHAEQLTHLDEHNKRLKKETIIDGLSGLYNRKYLRNYLGRLIKEHNESQYLFSIMLLDVDNFKFINDQMGHMVGDEVIHVCGKRLNLLKQRQYKRTKMCRLGGDEFLIIMPGYSIEESKDIAKTIKQELERPIRINEKGHIKITISAGVTQIDKEEDIDLLLQRCDDKMYEAKNSGKNTITY